MLNVEGRHDAIKEFEDRFETDHLPAGLPQQVGVFFHDQAQQLIDLLPDGPALTRAVHRVWEAKNEAVTFAVRVQRLQASDS